MSARIIPVEPFDLVVFGGTGDLAMRKLLPGLYHRDLDDQLPAESRILGVSRGDIARADYVATVEKAVRQHIDKAQIEPEVLARFLARLDHVTLDAAGAVGWKKLATVLQRKPNGIRVFYLATAPRLFGPIARNLASTVIEISSSTRCEDRSLTIPVQHRLAVIVRPPMRIRAGQSRQAASMRDCR